MPPVNTLPCIHCTEKSGASVNLTLHVCALCNETALVWNNTPIIFVVQLLEIKYNYLVEQSSNILDNNSVRSFSSVKVQRTTLFGLIRLAKIMNTR